MQAQMTPKEILSAGGEVAELVLRHTATFVEAVKIPSAAVKAAIAQRP